VDFVSLSLCFTWARFLVLTLPQYVRRVPVLRHLAARSSGPQPLVNLFDFTVELFKKAAGRQLKPLECHDLVCKIAEVVVVGGVRRSALISLGDLNDYDMAKAKSGQWWETEPQRALANNSATYYSKPSIGEFLKEWTSLYESQVRRAWHRQPGEHEEGRVRPAPGWIKVGRNEPVRRDFLRPYQFCNLTEIIMRRRRPLSR
jgi:ribonucleoside-triphosphate reductase